MIDLTNKSHLFYLGGDIGRADEWESGKGGF